MEIHACRCPDDPPGRFAVICDNTQDKRYDDMNKISWGVLSTARIGTEKVIPALQRGTYSVVHAIASRTGVKAQQVANRLGIPRAYGSYDALLEDPHIQAVYIPLPNHLHVEWTIRALEAGKHVLCEKPVGLNEKEAAHLNEETKKYPDLRVMEAFMYRFHPQWHRVKQWISGGTIGEVRHIHSIFSICNVDPGDIRNRRETGGGGLLDVGCYCISLARFLFDDEPNRVSGTMAYDPRSGVDRLTSGMLEFEKGTATFTCATQLERYQHAEIYGSHGRIDVACPFTPPRDHAAKICCHAGSGYEEVTCEACDQYAIQGDMFSLALLKDRAVPTPLEDGVSNMRVIDGIVTSAREDSWIML